VDNCGADLSSDLIKSYNRRNRVCDQHMRDLSVAIRGQQQRFCQQVCEVEEEV
jgi:hypothetical protein